MNPTEALLIKMYKTLAMYEDMAQRSRSRGFNHQAFVDEKNVKRMRKAIEKVEKGN